MIINMVNMGLILGWHLLNKGHIYMARPFCKLQTIHPWNQTFPENVHMQDINHYIMI